MKGKNSWSLVKPCCIPIACALFLLASINSIGQNLDSEVKKINKLQLQRLQNISSKDREAVFLEFDLAINHLFINKKFCKYSFDNSLHNFLNSRFIKGNEGETLAYAFINNIVICTSSNGKIRTFSWDDLNGGSGHSYTNFIQSEHPSGTCHIVEFDSSESNMEVGYYDIKMIRQDGRDFYFLFGYGSNGGGMHHHLIRIFEIGSTGLKECYECYENGKAIEIVSNRIQDNKIQFSIENGELIYKKYLYDDSIGFFTDQYELIKLVLTKGVLVKQ